jgi:hypothetical protein
LVMAHGCFNDNFGVETNNLSFIDAPIFLQTYKMLKIHIS